VRPLCKTGGRDAGSLFSALSGTAAPQGAFVATTTAMENSLYATFWFLWPDPRLPESGRGDATLRGIYAPGAAGDEKILSARISGKNHTKRC
jgi:hypothetical protein